MILITVGSAKISITLANLPEHRITLRARGCEWRCARARACVCLCDVRARARARACVRMCECANACWCACVRVRVRVRARARARVCNRSLDGDSAAHRRHHGEDGHA